MAKYAYSAKDVTGKVLQGELEAGTQQEALLRIRSQKLSPMKLVLVKNEGFEAFLGGMFEPKVNMKDLQIFTRQFSTLINSGIPVMDSLKILSDGMPSGLLKTAATKAKVAIEQGRKLGEALALSPNVFNRLYTNMIRAGEEAGILDGILGRLSIYMEKSEKIKGQVKGALVYPAVILGAAGLVIAGILFFVIPRMQEFYSSMGGELPWLTQAVISFSNTLLKRWYFVVAAAITTPLIIKQWMTTPAGRDVSESFFIRAPIFGPVVQKEALARTTRTLSTLISSGVGLLDAIEIAARTSGNIVVEKALLRSKESVTIGKPFYLPLQKEPVFPTMVVQMISIGEQSGTLDVMLGKVADFYEDDIETAIKAMTSLIEPLLMVFLGGIIAVLVLAMYLPIFGMADAMGKANGI